MKQLIDINFMTEDSLCLAEKLLMVTQRDLIQSISEPELPVR